MNNPRHVQSFQLGLIGWPLRQSLSPQIQSAALEAAGLAGDYRLYPLPETPDGLRELEKLLEEMRAGALHGLNVTIPYKRTVMRYLDDLTGPAEAVGAVNTILLAESRLIGDNTDAAGFLADLVRLELPAKRTSVVLGAGGSARAVVYALAGSGWSVFVAARRVAQAQALIQDLKSQSHVPPARLLPPVPLNNAGLGEIVPECRLIVNATPVGMYPDVDLSPWPAAIPFPAGSAVYDLVYNPRQTALVREARKRGLPAMTGLGMLVEQAALAFERWTRQTAPRQAMSAAVGLPYVG